MCLWKLHINDKLEISGKTDSCFSRLNQTQLVIDVRTALDVAFSDPSLYSEASYKQDKMALAFSCLRNELSGFNGKSVRGDVLLEEKKCFPSDAATTRIIVAAVIKSFDLLALSSSK